jgi:periplasmic copper chaperone A
MIAMRTPLLALMALLGMSSAAFGHAALNAAQAEVAALTTFEFRITHGCDGQPTNRVTLRLPEGGTCVTPRKLAGFMSGRMIPARGQPNTQPLSWS